MIARFYYSHDRATRWRLLGAVALACVVLIWRFSLANIEESTWTIQYGGYWIIAGTFLIFAVLLWAEVRAHWPGWARLRRHWPGLLAGVAIALFWQAHEPRDFKILFDEHVLGGIARGMHYDRQAAYAGYAHYANGRLTTLGLDVDKRPLMYPFLVSVVHDLTGFRPENSFVVNGLLGFVLLMLTYGLGAAMGGWRVGCFGQFLLASLPLIAQNATGGGFDLLNATLLTLFVITAWNYWRQPGTGGLDLMVYTGVVLANCRYESMLFLVVLAVLVLLKWVRERRITLTLASALSPALVLPPLLLNLIFMGTGNGRYFQTSKENFLNISHFGDNAIHAAIFLFSPTGEYNNSFLLSVLGVAALLLVVVWSLRRFFLLVRDGKYEIPLLLAVFGVLGVSFISWLSFWGHWEDALVERFSLPMYMGFVWCVMFAATHFLRGRQLPAWVIGGAAIYSVAAGAPVSSLAVQSLSMESYAVNSWARDYVLKHTDNSVLIISRASVMFTLYGRPNIHIGIANHNPLKVTNTLALGLYREIWVVQEYELNAKLNAWVQYWPARLDQRFILQPIIEEPIGILHHVRISKIVGYDPDKPAGIYRLAGEADPARAEQTRKDLGGDFTPPSGTENVLTERPDDEPAAFPMFTEFPGHDNGQEFMDYLMHQYP